MKTRLELVRYQIGVNSLSTGWVGPDGSVSTDGPAILVKAVAHLSSTARVVQIIELKNTQFNDSPPHYGILVEEP